METSGITPDMIVDLVCINEDQRKRMDDLITKVSQLTVSLGPLTATPAITLQGAVGGVSSPLVAAQPGGLGIKGAGTQGITNPVVTTSV